MLWRRVGLLFTCWYTGVVQAQALHQVTVDKVGTITPFAEKHFQPANIEVENLNVSKDLDPNVNRSTWETSSGLGSFGHLYNQMSFTVFRIEAIVKKHDWLRPFVHADDEQFVGSSFAVQLNLTSDSNPVLVTNAHVVVDAYSVKVQLPSLGQKLFDAYVPLICTDYDLAIVRLTEPDQFWKALQARNRTLQALTVREIKMQMGMDVVAAGFPMGSTSLKLSRGIIAGTQEVDGLMQYQSTAPISPGSSGGPLFALGTNSDLRLVGVNFASSSSTSAQNINYVRPLQNILQFLNEYQSQHARTTNCLVGGNPFSMVETQQTRGVMTRLVRRHDSGTLDEHALSLKAEKTEPCPHNRLRIAPIGARTIETNEVLYKSSGGCGQGVFLTHIEPTSVLHAAVPPVVEHSFLTTVAGVMVDGFGMGRTEEFLGDPIPFQSLMLTRQPLISYNITLESCLNSTRTNHTLSMAWRPEFEMGVRDVSEPYFEQSSADYEIFADLTFMQMTLNHVQLLLNNADPDPSLFKWKLRENRLSPRLIITDVKEGTYASRVMRAGMVVQSVNGYNVETLAEFRNHFVPTGPIWFLETADGLISKTNFTNTLHQQMASAGLSSLNAYLLTPAVRAAFDGSMAASTPITTTIPHVTTAWIR